jgi:uncharacterized protein (DUF3084 family)
MRQLGMVDVTRLRLNEDYERLFDTLAPDEYDDLARSIRNNGVLNALTVEANGDGTYTILSGCTRFKIANKHSIRQVPCQEAETVEERVTALYDNVLRRQLDSKKRKELSGKMDKAIDEMYQNALIPELFTKYKAGTLLCREARWLATASKEDQHAIANKLAIEKEVPASNEEYDKKIAELEQIHDKKVKDLQGKITELNTNLKKESEAKAKLENEKKDLEGEKREAEESLKTLQEQQAVSKEKLEKAMKKYTADKETMTKEAAAGVEKQISEMSAAIEQNAATIRVRQEEISQRDERIRALGVEKKGLETRINMMRQGVESLNNKYTNLYNKFSNPGILRAHVIAMQEAAKAILKWVKEHKVTQLTRERMEGELSQMRSLLEEISKEMEINLTALPGAEDFDTVIDTEMVTANGILEEKRKEMEAIIQEVRRSTNEENLKTITEAIEKKRRELEEEAAVAHVESKGKKVINLKR